MYHTLWTGFFELEDGHVRLIKASDGEILWVVKRPIDETMITKMLQFDSQRLNLTEHDVCLTEDGVLVSDQHTRDRRIMELIVAVAENTGAEIWSEEGMIQLS